MRIWIDCEWNGYRGDLISIALVSQDRSEFYAALEQSASPSWEPWVAEHVIPRLAIDGSMPPFMPVTRLQAALELWLSGFASVQLVADWPEDIEWFCRLLVTGPGTRLNTPPLVVEIRRDLDSVDSLLPHNALADARALRRADELSRRED